MSPKTASPIQQKILLLLFGGLAFGLSYTPRNHLRILRGVAKGWKKINEDDLKREIRNLYRTKMIEKKERPDGTVTITLTDKGKFKALTYKFRDMKIEKGNWDGKWRIVIFDIPEKSKRGRDALREKLKEIGFHELQKSVFVSPYNCKNEVEFIIEFFDLRKYVRFGILDSIDNAVHLKNIFNLP